MRREIEAMDDETEFSERFRDAYGTLIERACVEAMNQPPYPFHATRDVALIALTDLAARLDLSAKREDGLEYVYVLLCGATGLVEGFEGDIDLIRLAVQHGDPALAGLVDC